MCTALNKLLPKYANLSITSSFCPFIVMAGSLYGFPDVAGAQPQSSCAECDIVVDTSL